MRSKLVFYDTWAYVALADRSEKSAHQAADRTNRVLLDKRYTPVTTNYILDESLTLIRNRLGHGAAIRFRDDLELGIEANLVRLEWITEAREREAMALFRRYDDKPKLSFTDCTTFIVMRLLDITLAFTADEHFERTEPLHPRATLQHFLETGVIMAKKRIPAELQIWMDARKKYHLSHAQIQMARELGMNPKRFRSKANHRQEPWKAPLPEFIEHLYFKCFGKTRPDRVVSIEERAKEIERKKAEKLERKRLNQEANSELAPGEPIL